MNEKIVKTITSTSGRLIFGLISGGAYFAIILLFVKAVSRGSGMVAYMFSPAIICGAAFVLIKLIRNAEEIENNGAIIRIFYIHAALVVMAAFMLAAS